MLGQAGEVQVLGPEARIPFTDVVTPLQLTNMVSAEENQLSGTIVLQLTRT